MPAPSTTNGTLAGTYVTPFQNNGEYTMSSGSATFPTQDSYDSVQSGFQIATGDSSQIARTQHDYVVNVDPAYSQVCNNQEQFTRRFSIEDYSGVAERQIGGAQVREPLHGEQTRDWYSSYQDQPDSNQSAAISQSSTQPTASPSMNGRGNPSI